MGQLHRTRAGRQRSVQCDVRPFRPAAVAKWLDTLVSVCACVNLSQSTPSESLQDPHLPLQ